MKKIMSIKYVVKKGGARPMNLLTTFHFVGFDGEANVVSKNLIP
jgi:hypothetical protein